MTAESPREDHVVSGLGDPVVPTPLDGPLSGPLPGPLDGPAGPGTGLAGGADPRPGGRRLGVPVAVLTVLLGVVAVLVFGVPSSGDALLDLTVLGLVFVAGGAVALVWAGRGRSGDGPDGVLPAGGRPGRVRAGRVITGMLVHRRRSGGQVVAGQVVPDGEPAGGEDHGTAPGRWSADRGLRGRPGRRALRGRPGRRAIAVGWSWSRRQLTAGSGAPALPVVEESAEQRAAGLYRRALEQLDSDRPTERLGGLLALERLAHDMPERRQDAVDVLCGYLRRPYAVSGPAGPDAPADLDRPADGGRAVDADTAADPDRAAGGVADSDRGARPGDPAGSAAPADAAATTARGHGNARSA